MNYSLLIYIGVYAVFAYVVGYANGLRAGIDRAYRLLAPERIGRAPRGTERPKGL